MRFLCIFRMFLVMFIIIYADAAAGSLCRSVGPAMLWNWILLVIFLETPAEKAEICSCIYMRNVSEDHRPNFLMVSRSMLLSFMAMAPPARRE